MIQRIAILIFILLTLTGASASGVGDYAIVDDNPAPVRGTYATVQAAIESGAEWIEVRAGEYGGFSLNQPNVTIVMQGARFHNANDLTIWIDAAAVGATLQGDWEIYGDNTGVALGDNFHGTGVYNNAPHVTLEGLRCTNLLAFCVLNPVATAHHVTIKDCHIENVATSPTPQLLAGTGILFINGSSFNEVSGCYIAGQSQAIGTWYGASHNKIHNNRLVDNYGWIGINTPRSAIEDYGVDGAINTGNEFYNNLVDGSNASAFELADELRDVVVRNNTVYNVKAAFWMGGSGDNKSLNATIEGNTFYGHSGVISNWFSGTGRIVGNTFYDWDETGTTGTIIIPSDALGDVDIVGNEFKGGTGVLRASTNQGTIRFKDNRVSGASMPSIGILYFDDVGRVEIEGNLFEEIEGRVVNQANNLPITVKDNTIYGGIWVGEKSVVSGNTFYSPYDVWAPVYIQSEMTVRDNLIFADNTPIVIDGGATGAMITDNFVARLNGTAAALPTCAPGNTCRDNWTVP